MYQLLLNFHFEQVTLVELAQATRADTNRLSGSYNRSVFSHRPGGWGEPKSKVKVPANWVSGKSSLPACRWVTFPLCSHGLFFVCMERGGESNLSGVGTSGVGVLMRALIPSWGPTLLTSSKPNHLHSPTTITLGSGLQCYVCLGDIQSIMGLPLRRKF